MNQQSRCISSCAPQEPMDGPRTVYGFHGDRLAGLRDLFQYARGMSVLDIAMNHGLTSLELARRGVSLVHGCDYHEPAVSTARSIFAEFKIPSRFEVVDLTGGPEALQAAFGADYLPRYDIVLFLGIYHKLKDQTSDAVIEGLVRHLAARAAHYFVVRAANTDMLDEVGLTLRKSGLRKVHFSALSMVVGPMEIWQRGEVSPYIGTHQGQ
jgi:SAM-dependent methyltransferase